MTDSQTYHLFVSYSRANSDIKDKLQHDLEEIGLLIWTDELIPSSMNWKNEICNSISDCMFVMYLASPEACASKYVYYELGYADGIQKQIIPIWIAGDKWVNCVPEWMVTTQYAGDIRNNKYSENLNILQNSIKDIVYNQLNDYLVENDIVRWNGSLYTMLKAIHHFSENQLGSEHMPYSHEFYIEFIGGDKWALTYETEDEVRFHKAMKSIEQSKLMNFRKLAEYGSGTSKKTFFGLKLTKLGQTLLKYKDVNS